MRQFQVDNKVTPALSDKEAKLIMELRRIRFGKFEVHIEEGQPVRIVEIRENIKL